MFKLRSKVLILACSSCIFRLRSRGIGAVENTCIYARAYSADAPTRPSSPQYNYGLHGKGKSRHNIWKKQAQSKESVAIQGEVLFGIHPVLLALGAQRRQHFYSLYLESKQQSRKRSEGLSRIAALAEKQNVAVHYVPKKTLTYLSGDRPHQGVCLDTSNLVLPDLDPQTLFHQKTLDSNTTWILPYNVQDPMNFGAILRSSFFLGVDRVVVPASNSCAPSPVVSKASAGALEVIDLCQIPAGYRSMLQLAKAWQTAGGVVVGTASDTDKQHTTQKLQDFTPSVPILLVVGNEGSGIDADVLDLCDVLLTIAPCSDRAQQIGVESLNVSVAAGILLHWLQVTRRSVSLQKNPNA